jgi:hypothetical protein
MWAAFFGMLRYANDGWLFPALLKAELQEFNSYGEWMIHGTHYR